MLPAHAAIVLLGSPNAPDGTLLDRARERCDTALDEYRRHPDHLLIPTGGFGEHFNTSAEPHHAHTRRYLLAHGVPADAILPGVDSSSTVEDAALTRPLVDHYGLTTLRVVTSDFHVPRARFLFGREFPDLDLTFVPARTMADEAELAGLHAHEQRALVRLQAPGS